MYTHGWYLVAYARDLNESVTPISIGNKRLMLVCQEDGLHAYGADCPHRGVDLGRTGRLDGCTMVCSFHGYRIALGGSAEKRFRVPEYETIVRGGLVFVRLSDSHDNGFSDFIKQLSISHTIVPGITMSVRAPAPLVIENGFDNRHFPAVHGIANDPEFVVRHSDAGAVIVTSTFEAPGGYQDAIPYEAHTFSPGLITVMLDGKPPYNVITGATPEPDGTTTIRLSLALSRAKFGPYPNERFVQQILEYSHQALKDDAVMWETMNQDVPHNFTPQDNAVLAFQQFCDTFVEAA